MFDPVNLGDDTEHAYEREELERYVARPGALHPFTRAALPAATKLVSNQLLRRMIQEYLTQHAEVALSADEYYLSARCVGDLCAALRLQSPPIDAVEVRRLLDKDRRLLFLPFDQCGGMTALHVAASAPNANAVETLLGELRARLPDRLPAVVGCTDDTGRLAVHCALQAKLESTTFASLMAATLEAGVQPGKHAAACGAWLDECFAVAVRDARLQVAAALLQLGADINSGVRLADDGKFAQANVDFKQVVLNPLLRASAAGALHTVEFLLEHAADLAPRLLPMPASARTAVSAQPVAPAASSSSSGAAPAAFTALHCAACAGDGNSAVVKLLLQRGANVNAIQQTGLTALHFCYGHKQLDLVRLLLDAGADLNLAGHGIHGFTPLVLAVYNQNVELSSLLLSRGSDVNFRAQNGLSALAVAVMRANEPLVEMLLGAGASLDAKCVKLGPLAPDTDDIGLFCLQRGLPNILELLLSHGADANRPTGHGTTLLHEAVAARRTDCAAVLLRHGAAPTALHQAAASGSVALCRLLLEHGADLNQLSAAADTPLHVACDAGCWPVAELLLSPGWAVPLDPAVRDAKGRTALHRAVSRGAPAALLDALWRLGADESIDCQDADGNTALHVAIMQQQQHATANAANSRATMYSLLQNGACCFIRNNQARTPLDLVPAAEAAAMRDTCLHAMHRTTLQLRADNRKMQEQLQAVQASLAALTVARDQSSSAT
eukprot:TRINITY_DN1314_c0_g1_i1.p2 TRINITY_DN1314_c0_g1~~TRINITY_DN1314_c0_g1_i1.p2  ORF type:complete len:724 (+),score=332.26 TRINITY_DN1314_c0_g1_i1:296-2467(+)